MNRMGGGNANFGKAKNFKKSIGSLAKYCKKQTFWIVLSVILSVTATILTLIGPNLISKITDLIESGLTSSIDIEGVIKIATILIVMYSTSYVLSYAQGFTMSTITQVVAYNLRKDITNKINKLPLKYIDGTTHGDILSRVTNDVDTISQTLNNSVTTLISSLTLLIGSLVMMIVTNPIMAAAAVASSIIGFVIISIIMKNTQKYFIAQQQGLGDINGHIEEIYSGHTVVKVSNAEKETFNQFDAINKKLYSSAWKSQFFSGIMMPLMHFIGNLGYVFVCVIGGVLISKGAITFGVISAFMIYIRLFTQPLSQLAQVFTNLQSTAAASERVFEFLNEKELDDESNKTKVLTNVLGDVEFKNVKFGYEENKIIIKDFSAKIKHGQKVAIVGPTGAGKTTLVNLLMRFYEVNDGDILIDGVSTKSITRENVHNLFSMVLQDTWMFEGSVKDNIRYSEKNITDEQIVEACKACGLHHFIKTLPNGYDTILDDNTSISAGQKQLLTIARAMVQNSPMLILDEATSSVDTRTEALIQKAMDELTKNKTSFVIAHRLSTIKNADLILVLNNGDVVEKGNHEQLIAKNGVYADLYNSQFEEK